MMKKRYLFLLAVLTVFTSGCALPEKYPIEKIQNILVVGVDIEDGQVKLTVVVDKISEGSEPGKEQISSEIYTAVGQTIFEAKRYLHSYAAKRTSWYHLKYILIGEEAAKQGIGTALDFFCENDENRFLHRLVVSREMSAEAFITSTVTHTNDLADTLDSLFEDTKRTGLSSEVHLLDYANSCECKWACLYVPTVELAYATHHASADGEGSEDDLDYLPVLAGYAVFQQDYKLAGYIDGDETLGMNIVLNKLESAAVIVTDIHGQLVSLEVMSSKTNIKTNLNDTPSATIKVEMTAFMVEYHETQDVLEEEYISYLEDQMSAKIKNAIEQALSSGQRWGTDVFGIGSALYHAYPITSRPFKANWPEWFSTMGIQIEVSSQIQCTYSMLNAAEN